MSEEVVLHTLTKTFSLGFNLGSSGHFNLGYSRGYREGLLNYHGTVGSPQESGQKPVLLTHAHPLLFFSPYLSSKLNGFKMQYFP